MVLNSSPERKLRLLLRRLQSAGRVWAVRAQPVDTPGLRDAQLGGVRKVIAGIGWHYLSDATCLMRPHVFSTALLV